MPAPHESSSRRVYSILDAPTHGEAVEALAGFAPGLVDLYEGGSGAGFFFIPRVKVDAVPAGHLGTWRGFADYSSFAPDEFAFDLGGGTEHILVNDRGPTFRYAPPGKTAPDFKGLIGVNGDSIDGCDIPPGNLSRQYTRKKVFLAAQINEAYIATLESLRNAVNDAPFYGLDAGEALLLGVSGRTIGDGTWEMQFRWAGQANRSDFGIPETSPVIDGIDKQGWDYLWVLSEDDEDTSAHALVKRPIAAYVERVMPRADFGLLGIGVALP